MIDLLFLEKIAEEEKDKATSRIGLNALGAGIGSSITGSAATLTSALAASPKTVGINRNKEQKAPSAVLKKQQEYVNKNLGTNKYKVLNKINIHPSVDFGFTIRGPHAIAYKPTVKALEKGVLGKADKEVINAFKKQPYEGHIYMPRDLEEGLLSHETGHIKAIHNNRFFSKRVLGQKDGMLTSVFNKARIISSIPAALSAAHFIGSPSAMYFGGKYIANAKTKDEVDERKNRANAVSSGIAMSAILPHIPTLGTELEASYEGSKMLYKHLGSKGVKGISRLARSAKAFRGVPSYIASAAATPLIMKGLSSRANEQIAEETKSKLSK